MDIKEFLKSKETYLKLVDKLSTYTNLNEIKGGYIAGGSISNILFSMVHGGEPVINDIDVYHQIYEKKGIYLSKVAGWYPSSYVREDGLTIVDDDYGRVFISAKGARMQVKSHSRKGILNIIEYVYEDGNNKTTKDRDLIILEGFDLNCCKSGLDIEKKEIVFTDEFVDFLETKQLKVVSPCAPIQTTIRIKKKLRDLDCFCDIEHEMRFLTIASKKITGSQMTRYIGDETYAKYEKHKDFVDKYFTLREPKNLDELPESLRSTYYFGGKRNPNVNIWLFDAKLDFDIVEAAHNINYLKKIWNLLYTYKSKSEQTKINKIFYKNVYLGNMMEDQWTYQKWISQGKYTTESYYNSHRFTFQMILTKKDYYKCNFDIKHVDFIDKFVEAHLGLARILKWSNTLTEQYKLIKLIKSIAKKEGEWIIGVLETMDLHKHTEFNENTLIDENIILKVIKDEKIISGKDLVEKINLDGFYYKDCVRELPSVLDLRIEGSKMGHCVGGYSNPLSNGVSRIFHVDCDGIGSTVEISIPKREKYISLIKDRWLQKKDEKSKLLKIVEIFHPTQFADSECVAVYENGSTDNIRVSEVTYRSRQHYGRYPEKGNLTPTDTNKLVVKELVKYLNKNHLPENYNVRLGEEQKTEYEYNYEPELNF